MIRHLLLPFLLICSISLFAQEPCIGASGQIIADSFYSDYDNYYQQCSGETMTFICQNVVLPDNGEIQSIRWRINEAELFNQSNDTLELLSYNELLGNLYADIISTTGCAATFQLDNPILFINTPNILLDETRGSCAHEGAPVSVTISSDPVEDNFSAYINELQFFDDNILYTSTITVTGYDSPTILDCSMLNSVFVNFEHSYFGDLGIRLTCPNGDWVLLVNNTLSIGGAYLGDALDDETMNQGVGYTYEWNQEADSALNKWTQYAIANNNRIIPAGAYLPDQSLCGLIGCPINGPWTLLIDDAFGSDNGNVFSWGLTFETSSSAQYDPSSSSYYSYAWSSDEFLLTDQSVTEATATINTSSEGTINYTYTNSAGCQVNKSKEFTILDFEPTIIAGNDISFIDNPNPLVDSEILLLNSDCQYANFDTTICYGNNAFSYYTFCAPDYFDCHDLFSMSISGLTEISDDFIIWEGTDINAEPISQNQLNADELLLSTQLDCFTLLIDTDGSVSCEDAYRPPIEISLKPIRIPNVSIQWEPSEYFENPDSTVSSIAMPTEDIWATVTFDIPNYSGCYSSDSLYVTIPDNSFILTVFHDNNENGVLDPNENTIPYFPVTVGNVGTLYTNASGQASSSIYEAISFEVSIDQNQWNFTTPSFINVDGSGWNGYAIEYFIGVSPTANLVTDLEVSLEGINGSCNIINHPQATVFNNANYFPGGQIQIELDPLYTFISSEPAPVSSSNNQLIYEIPSLDYHGDYTIHMNVINPDASYFGTDVSSVAKSYYYISQGVLSDIIDTDSVNLELTCAYDPNNKITHTGAGALNIIDPNTRLDYTINFQNIGNAEAQTVYITDELPAQLVPTTLQPIAWSHDFDLTIIGNFVIFTFENIDLPGIEQDSAASMGFVRFTIEQQPNLAPATLIQNTASIVFDTNVPISTNTTSNLISDNIGITENQSNTFEVFPNPSQDIIYWNNTHYRLNRINTVGGQTVYAPKSNLATYNMSHLAPGIYYFEFISNDGDRVKRTVVKQ